MIEIKAVLLSTILAIVLSACAPPATAVPTGVPTVPQQVTALKPTPGGSALETPRPAGTPPPNSIKLSNVETARQPNGDIRTTASASTQDNLGLGQMEVSSPERMMLGDTVTVRLRISPATQLTSSTPIPAPPAQTPDLPGFVYRFGGNVQLYPLMIAQLRAITFGVNPENPQRRAIQSSAPVEWSWLVQSRTAGRQDMVVELAIPAVVDGTVSEISTDVLRNLSVTIQVETPVTPTPASHASPTPDAFWSNVSRSIADNSGPIIIALIGLAGTLIGILVKTRSDSSGSKRTRKRD